MLEALSRFIEPIIQFPFSTGVHWLLMSIAGYLIANSEHHGGQHIRILAVCIIALWTGYELAEFAQLHDNVSGDLANGLIAYLVGTFGTLLYHRIRRHHNA